MQKLITFDGYEIDGRRVRKLLLAMVVAGYSLALAGCNTVEGVGEDVERGGEEIQDISG